MNSMIVGALITAISQMVEVAPYSNSVAYLPNDLVEVTQFLDEADKLNLTPVIVIDKYYLDVSNKYTYVDPSPLKQAIRDSNHIGRILFMYDEPGLRGRRNGQTMSEILPVFDLIKKDFHGVEFVHIESFAEMYWQKQENNGRLSLYMDAEHIGFNCYGKFEKCGNPAIGVPEVHQLTYLADIHSEIVFSNSDSKIFLVPGAFMGGDFFESESEVTTQLDDYASVAVDYRDYVSGMGVFIWGDFHDGYNQLSGARSLPLVKEKTLEVLNYLK